MSRDPVVPGGGQSPRQVPSSPAPQGEAERPRGCFSSVAAAVSVVLGAVYVINPGAGILELLPDNFPLFGNLDEAAATTMLVLGLQHLFGRGRKGSRGQVPPQRAPGERTGEGAGDRPRD